MLSARTSTRARGPIADDASRRATRVATLRGLARRLAALARTARARPSSRCLYSAPSSSPSSSSAAARAGAGAGAALVLPSADGIAPSPAAAAAARVYALLERASPDGDMAALARAVAEDGGQAAAATPPHPPPPPPPLAPAAAARLALALRALADWSRPVGASRGAPSATASGDGGREGERKRRRRARADAARALALALAAEAEARLRARQERRQGRPQHDPLAPPPPLDVGAVAGLLGGLARLRLYPPGSELVPRLADEAGMALQAWRRRRRRGVGSSSSDADAGDADAGDAPPPPKMSQLGRLGTALLELGCPPPSLEWRAAFAEAASAAGEAARGEQMARRRAEPLSPLSARVLTKSVGRGKGARRRRTTAHDEAQELSWDSIDPPRTFPVAPEAVAAVGAALAAWRDNAAPPLPGEAAWARRHWALLASPEPIVVPPADQVNPAPLVIRPGEALAAQLSLPQLVRLMRAAAALGGVRPAGGGDEGDADDDASPSLTAHELATCLVCVLERRALGKGGGGGGGREDQRGRGRGPGERNAARPELLAAALGALADAAFGGSRGAWLGWLQSRQLHDGGGAPALFTRAEADEMLLRARVALGAAAGAGRQPLPPDGAAELCWAVARLLLTPPPPPNGGDGECNPSPSSCAAWADEAALRLNDVSPGLGPRGLAHAVAASAASGRAPFSSLWRALYARWRVEAGGMGRDDALLALEALAALSARKRARRAREGKEGEEDEGEEDAAAASGLAPPPHEQSARARRERLARAQELPPGGRRRARAGAATGVPDTEALAPLLAALRRAAALGGGGGGCGGSSGGGGGGGGAAMSAAEMRRAALLLRRIYGGGGAAGSMPGRGAERLVAELEARAAFLEAADGDDDGRAAAAAAAVVAVAARRRRRARATARGGGPFDDS